MSAKKASPPHPEALGKSSAHERILRWNKFFDPNEEVPICVFPMPFHHFSDSHPQRHEFDELVVVTGGTATHTFSGQVFEMKRGDVFYIPKGHEHKIVCTQGGKAALTNILFDFDRLKMDWNGLASVDGFVKFFLKADSLRNGMKQQIVRLRLNGDETARIMTIVNNLEWELAKQAPGYSFFAKNQFARLIGLISRYASHVQAESSRWAAPLVPVISFMEERLDETLSVLQLAKVAGMSESNLRKTFQMVFKESPVHHLHRLRVEKSMEMLADNEKSITDIALKVGFSDGNYYNRIFRRLIGVCPSQYRRELACGNLEALPNQRSSPN